MKHFVYFIAENTGKGRAAKIGVAQDIAKRLATLQTGNPRDLILYATLGPMTRAAAYHLEARLQYCFRKYQIQGEWFHIHILSRLHTIREAPELEMNNKRRTPDELLDEDHLRRINHL